MARERVRRSRRIVRRATPEPPVRVPTRPVSDTSSAGDLVDRIERVLRGPAG